MVKGLDVSHGEAVVEGMKLETLLSYEMEWISEEDKNEIIEVLSANFNSLDFGEINFDEFEPFLMQDKKNTGMISISLPTKIGKCAYDK